MNKKTREKIEKKAAETVKARHLGEGVEKVAKELKAKSTPKAEKKEAKTPAGLPPLPKLPAAARVRKDKPVKPCACGNCGATTKGVWAPGHDAYVRGWAIRVERGICKLSEVEPKVLPGVKLMLAERKKMEAVTGAKPNIKIVKAKDVDPADLTAEGNVSDPAVGE